MTSRHSDQNASGGRVDGSAGPDPIGEIADSFLERRRRGERPTLLEYVERFPEHADDIRRLFPALEALEELGSDDEADSLDEFLDVEGAGAEDDRAEPRGAARLGDYRLLRVIGRGGMGVVYEAEQISLGRRVALKVFASAGRASPRHRERFQREVRAAARLHHPHIVPVFGAGEHRGVQFYAMQYVEGSGLDDVIREIRRLRGEARETGSSTNGSSSSLPSSSSELIANGSSSGSHDAFFRSVARIGRDAAAALYYAHGEGVVHRDIKPSNLLLDPRGHVWVTDFGLAKDETDDGLTQTGDVVGTVAYMAPERFDEWSDQRSDVYGLGLTLWELVAMRPAFHDRNRRRLIRKVSEEEAPALRRIEPRLPRDLETIILKATRREPADRYQTAGQMREDLERFLGGRTIQAERVSPTQRVVRWCERNRTVAWLAASLLVVLSAAAVGAWVLAYELEDRLRSSYRDQAAAHLSSRHPGAAVDALRAVELAARLGPSDADVLRLRRVASAALARADVPFDEPLAMSELTRDLYFDDDLRRCAELWSDGSVAIRALEDGRTLRRVASPGKVLDHACFGGDRWLAAKARGWTGDVYVWGLDSGDRVLTLEDGVFDRALDFSADGRDVVTGDQAGVITVTNVVSRSSSVRYRGRPNPRQIAVQPTGHLVAVVSGRHVDFVRLANGECVRTISCESQVLYSDWDASGERFVTPCRDGRIRVWRLSDGVELSSFGPSPLRPVHWARFVDDSDLLLAFDSRSRLWRWTSGRELLVLEGQNPASGAQGRIATNLGRHSVGLGRVVRSRTCRELGDSADRHKRIRDVALDSRERLLVYAVDDGLRLWDLRHGRQLAFLPIGETNGVRFDRRTRRVITSGSRGVFVWPLTFEVETGPLLVGPPLRVSDGFAHAQLDLDPTGRYAAVVRGDDVHLYDIDGEYAPRVVARHRYPSVDFDPRGRFLATGNWTGQDVHVWDVASGELLWSVAVPGHARPTFSPDGASLLVSSARRFAMLDVSSRKTRFQLERREASTLPGGLAFSPDGDIVALGVDRGTILLADSATGRELVTLEFPVGESLSKLRFSPSGRWLVAAADGACFAQDLVRLQSELGRLGLGGALPPISDDEKDAPPLAVEVDLGEFGE